MKKEEEMLALKEKGRHLLLGHELAAGYTDLKQQLHQLGWLIESECIVLSRFCVCVKQNSKTVVNILPITFKQAIPLAVRRPSVIKLLH